MTQILFGKTVGNWHWNIKSSLIAKGRKILEDILPLLKEIFGLLSLSYYFRCHFFWRFYCYFSLFLFISPILSEFRRWTRHFSIYWLIFSIRRPQSTSSLGFLWISKWNIGFFHKLLRILSSSLYLEMIYCHIFVVVITIQIILNRLFNLRG